MSIGFEQVFNQGKAFKKVKHNQIMLLYISSVGFIRAENIFIIYPLYLSLTHFQLQE